MVRETRRAGERGDARAFEYSLVAPAGSQGPPAPLRRRCPPGRCSGGALVTPWRRLRPEGRGLRRGEQRGRERDGARLPNEPHGLRLGRRGHLLGRGGGRDGEVGRGKCQTCRLAPVRRDACVGCHGRGGAVRGERWAPPRGAALTPPATPRTPLTLWGRHDRTRWSGGPSESPKRCSAGRWTRGWPKRAQSTEPIPGRPGRLARGPMVQPSCAWLERRRESSGGRRGREGGDAMRRGLIGGVERGGAKRRL